MIELVFTACMLASPERCDEKRLTYAASVSPMACMMQGQAELAKWGETHPKWRVTRWKCRFVQSAAHDI